MSNSHQTLDSPTAEQLQQLMADILRLLADNFDASTTINHLRVGNFISLTTEYTDRSTTNKEISEALAIPRCTVTRIVADLITSGYVTEKRDPDDGRIRRIAVVREHPRANAFKKMLWRDVQKLMPRATAGQNRSAD